MRAEFIAGAEDEWPNSTVRSRADWQRQMNLRLRAAFIAGAEEDSRRRLGRGLTKEELESVLRRYPGDL